MCSVIMLKTKEAMEEAMKGNHVLLLTDTSVTMIVTQRSFYRVIRVINHWIKHLIQQHNGSSTDEGIDSNASWYQQWTTLYKLMRSSKRTFRETYKTWTNDYSQEAPTPFSLVMDIVNTIPKLRQCYDIQYIDLNPNDPNNFKLTVHLYFFDDNENRFNAAASQSSFTPFLDNNSIVTMRTTESDVESKSNATGSLNDEDAINDDEDETKTKGGIEITPKLSTIPEDITINQNSNSPKISPKDSDLSFDTESKLDKNKEKYNKKANELRETVASACKDTITQIATHAASDIKHLNTILTKQTEILEKLVTQNSNVHPTNNSHQHGTSPPPVPSTSRFSTLPSPRPQASSFPASTPSTGTMRNQPPFQRAGVIGFNHDGAQYELNDTHFHKYSSTLIEVHHKHDLISYYTQLQAIAVMNNIFLTPFDALTVWDKLPSTIPTTCMLKTLTIHDNTAEAYKRMKSALYTKIVKSTIMNQQYKAIVTHHSTSQDGFEVLYDFATHCHPKLVISTSRVRDTNPRPSMSSTDSIYSYVKNLETWVEINTINGVTYNPTQLIDIVLEELRQDSRYDKAVTGMVNQLNMADTYNKQFQTNESPPALNMSNLPATVMSYYTDEECVQLFPSANPTINTLSTVPTPSSHGMDEICTAIINSFKSNKNITRKALNEICEGCGKFGHNVFQSGCDFCAQLLMARTFLDNNPKSVAPILRRYKNHQFQRQRNYKGKHSYSSDQQIQQRSGQKPRYNLRNKNKAKIKQMTDAMLDYLEDPDDDDSDTHSFHDAQSDDNHSSDDKEE